MLANPIKLLENIVVHYICKYFIKVFNSWLNINCISGLLRNMQHCSYLFIRYKSSKIGTIGREGIH